MKAGKDVRVTAGGASKMVIHSTTLLGENNPIETSYNGTDFVDVTGWFDATNAPIYVFITDPAAPKLLGSRIRVAADCLVLQED